MPLSDPGPPFLMPRGRITAVRSRDICTSFLKQGLAVSSQFVLYFSSYRGGCWAGVLSLNPNLLALSISISSGNRHKLLAHWIRILEAPPVPGSAKNPAASRLLRRRAARSRFRRCKRESHKANARPRSERCSRHGASASSGLRSGSRFPDRSGRRGFPPTSGPHPPK